MAKTFRTYLPEQNLLLPASLREWLPAMGILRHPINRPQRWGSLLPLGRLRMLLFKAMPSLAPKHRANYTLAHAQQCASVNLGRKAGDHAVEVRRVDCLRRGGRKGFKTRPLAPWASAQSRPGNEAENASIDSTLSDERNHMYLSENNQSGYR